MTLRLHISVPEQSEQAFELLDNSEHSVGRAAECTVRIVHGTLSARHASIRVSEGRLELRDDASRFGSQIGDRRLEPGRWYSVAAGQQVWLGDVVFCWFPVDDDRTVALDVSPDGASSAAEDGDLWSVAMERDSAHTFANSASVEPAASPSLTSGEASVAAPEPTPPAPSSATPSKPAASTVPPPVDAGPLARAKAAGQDASSLLPAEAPARRVPIPAVRIAFAGVSTLVALTSLAFAAWVAFGNT